jgi:hypothetical protein
MMRQLEAGQSRPATSTQAMRTSVTRQRSFSRPLGLTVGAMLMAAGLVFGNVSAATASSSSINGWQYELDNVYWSTARSNTYTRNYMRISPYNGTDVGIPQMIAGARWLPGTAASFAKTPGINPGSAAYFANVSSGSTYISPSTFYLTTYIGPSGCGCNGPLHWTATLYYNVGV